MRAAVARQGPVPWSHVVAEALYGPDGFYASGGGAGRTRDFITSAEIGPVFGAIVARAVDAAWVEAGRPDPWFVVDVGAGAGTLAAAVLAAPPASASALRYIAVEVSPALRAAAALRLPLEDPSQLLGPRVVADRRDADRRDADRRDADPDPDADVDPDDEATAAQRGLGPLVAVLGELPAGPLPGVVIANELLDNLPFDVYEWSGSEWGEVRVGWSLELDAFGEVVVPAAPEIAAVLAELVPSPPAGGRVPWEGVAAAWVRAARELIGRGRVIAIDYARATPVLAGLPGSAWLRTYRSGGRGASPLDALGQQDLTVDVAVDQLPAPSRTETQAAWLRRHGVEAVADEAAAAWRARAAIGDLEAVRARSTVSEVAALTDPDGLGGFTVCEWDVRGSV